MKQNGAALAEGWIKCTETKLQRHQNMVPARRDCQRLYGFSGGVSTGKSRVVSEPFKALVGGIPNPLGEAHVQCVFILQGECVGIKCRYDDETSREVRTDPGGFHRRAEHLTLSVSETAGERSTQERRTSYSRI